MTIENEATLRELAEKATPGARITNHYYECVQTHSNSAALSAICYRGKGPNGEADLDFIAACDPQTVIGLLDELTQLRAVAKAAHNRNESYLLGTLRTGRDSREEWDALDEALSRLKPGTLA